MTKDKEYIQGLEEYIRQGEPQKCSDLWNICRRPSLVESPLLWHQLIIKVPFCAFCK